MIDKITIDEVSKITGLSKSTLYYIRKLPDSCFPSELEKEHDKQRQIYFNKDEVKKWTIEKKPNIRLNMERRQAVSSSVQKDREPAVNDVGLLKLFHGPRFKNIREIEEMKAEEEIYE